MKPQNSGRPFDKHIDSAELQALVPSLVVARAQLRDRITETIRHPDIRSIKRRAPGSASHWKRAQVGAVTGAQLGYVLANGGRFPDIGPIQDDGLRTVAHVERADIRTVAGAQLGHGGAS